MQKMAEETCPLDDESNKLNAVLENLRCLNLEFLMCIRDLGAQSPSLAASHFCIPQEVVEQIVNMRRKDIYELSRIGRPIFLLQVSTRVWRRILQKQSLRIVINSIGAEQNSFREIDD